MRALALKTHAPTSRGLARVLGGELVATLTMSLGGVDRHRRYAAPHVLCLRHDLKVVGVDASVHAAQVVKNEAVRDWSTEVFV